MHFFREYFMKQLTPFSGIWNFKANMRSIIHFRSWHLLKKTQTFIWIWMTLYWVIYTQNTAKHETKDIPYSTDAAIMELFTCSIEEKDMNTKFLVFIPKPFSLAWYCHTASGGQPYGCACLHADSWARPCRMLIIETDGQVFSVQNLWNFLDL